MYASINFKTKKEFKEKVKAGARVTLRAPGLGSPKVNGVEFVEGPWYPEPHKWYAQVKVVDGVVKEVS